MNKLNAFMKEKYEMKSFSHTPSTKTLPEISTETINGTMVNDFMLHQKVRSIHPSQLYYQVEVKKVSTGGENLLVMM